MAQNTNLNVTPYYDDFDKDKNFYKVLFRPGFPIQARELTTMQSVLQNQIENVGQHLFKDGAMVIPGQVGYDLNVDAIMLQESFLGADVELYRTQLNGKIIEGLTTGVKAKVLFTISDTESDKGYITLYIKYIQSGGDESTEATFQDNEQLITDTEITFGTTLIEIGSPFAQLLPTSALQKGSVAYIQPGVYFIRGYFVDVSYQTVLLDQYGTEPRYRIGLEILESIVTPEDDLSLNDNAAGTSNYAAPGAHRFRITANLIKKLLTDDADKDFIELLRINGTKVEKLVDRSAYDELEKSMALRTYEESGDYVVTDFTVDMRENLDDGFNNGVYSSGGITSSGAVASEDLYSIEIGPGTAYVRGYRVKTLSPTYVDLDKPRETDSAQNVIVPFSLGNNCVVENVYGFLNISGSSISNAYQTLELRDNFTVSQGTAQGNIIGYARAATLEHIEDPDNTFGNADDEYSLHMFDVQMFVIIELDSNQTIDAGSLLVGSTSGAKGYIVNAVTNADHIQLYQVEGTFVKGEILTLDGTQLDTIQEVHVYQFSDVRQVAARDEVTTSIEFTADVVLQDEKTLQGQTFTYVATAGSETITGLNSNFAADLRAGDRIYFNSTDYVDVDYVDPTALTTSNPTTIFNFADQVVNVTPGASAPSAGTVSTLIRYRSRLEGSNNANLFSQLAKPFVKSISDESMIVRRTFDAQTVASNSISITLPENEQFEAISDSNYTITVLAGTNATHPVGDQVTIDTSDSNAIGYTSFTTSDRTTLQVDNLTNITSVKVTATISKNVTQRKTKSPVEMFVLKVNKTIQNLDKQNYGLLYSNLYGTRIEDVDVSLGLTDAYKIHAVYESLDDNDPVLPSVTLVEPAFFATGSIVSGRTSLARGRVVGFNSSTLKLSIVYLDGSFQPGETIDGFDSTSASISAIINDSVGSVESGSKVITDRYRLETGQTNFQYAISKIVREKGVATPIRKLKIVFDYYNHSATGDYFGGQSYLNTSYSDVPTYDGRFLSDYLDFRPGVKNLYSGAGSVASPAYVNCSTLDFKSRVYPTSGTPGATLFDIPKIDSDFRCDFDWYLPRIDKLFLSPDGEFKVIKGKSEELPGEPDDLQESMLLATLRHAPYGFDPNDDVIITKSENRRYTMRDIGKLEKRIDQVEYYTSLNMLESDTFNVDVLDATGKNRLKNGFIVDDFTDHSKSSTTSVDYSASLDFEEGVARPSHYTTAFSLILNDSLSTNIQRTGATTADDEGAIISLPYTEQTLIEQPYASRVENVNPFNVFAYIGNITLDPASDNWVDTKRLPTRVTTIEGNFQATRQRLNATGRGGFAPIQWGSWRTNWTGRRTSGSRTWREHTFANFVSGRGRRVLASRTVTTTRRQTRTGIRTRVVPRIDRQSLGDSIVSSTSISWMRSRNIRITAERMKPRTRFYIFFDRKNINDYVTPKIIEVIKDPSVDSRTNSIPFVPGETITGTKSKCKLLCLRPDSWFNGYNPYDDSELPTSYSSNTNFVNHNVYAQAMRNGRNAKYYGNIQVGEVLRGASGAKAVVKDRRHVTDRFGKYRGNFFIPEPIKNVNPRWKTGTRTLRMTSQADDTRIPGAVASSGEVEFTAAGTLQRIRENVLAVRNADVVRDTVTQRRTVRTTRTETRQVGWWDPLAQSFLVDIPGGIFVTSVEIYFYATDATIPISMQIRTMENGYPTTSILPFSDVTIEPTEIQTSETASIPTKFTFRAPVYIPQSIEHCFVLFSDSNEYQVWISRMGDQEIGGDRTISEQPYAGVLFKSQNATTWTADQYEDMKFKLNRAVFDNTQNSVVVYNNAELRKGNGGVAELPIDSVQTFQPELQLVLNSTTLPYTKGARVYQKTTLAEGTIVDVDETAGGVVLTVNDISGTFAAGSDTGGVITNRLVSSKTTATVVVTGATGDFIVGETVTGDSAAAPTGEVVSWDSGTNTLELRYVSTNFDDVTPETITGSESAKTASISTSTAPVYSGDAVEASAVSDAFPETSPTFTTTQRRVRIIHTNHGMHSLNNNVSISGVISEVSPTTLTSSISATDTTINVNDGSAFHKIINGASISNSNVGYIRVSPPSDTDEIFPLEVGLDYDEDEYEIMSYEAISGDGKTITITERGLDGTTARAFSDESVVECYNLDGIPLTEINKTHTAISNPTLDTYDVVTSSIARLGIRSGGEYIQATQNIQYEVLAPQIEKMLLPGCNITARVNTVTGTSINDGTSLTQNSFANTGEFYDILLDEDNYFTTPQIICSQINESSELSGGKSFRMDITLTSETDNVSPIIDMDRLSMLTTSNRINNPSNANDALISEGDTHEAIYITKIATLTNPSSAIKLIFGGYRPPNTQIKPLYRVLPTGSTDPIESYGWSYFPTNDATIPGTTEQLFFSDYEYEVSGLDFTQYQVKILFISPNQASVPQIQDFRAIALAV